jgi:CDP-diacylglycerol--serine O-phosphatidyltransferase
MLMVQTVATYLPGGQFDLFHQNSTLPGKLVFAIGLLYVCCAILRLARFNTENAPDALKHMSFKGLPAPGAAAAVAAIVLLFDSVQKVAPGAPLQSLRQANWLEASIDIVLPVATALVALAMISKFRYVHVVNRWVTGRKPFGYLVKALGVILLGLAYPELVLALATLGYAASGPVGALVRHFVGDKQKLPPAVSV